jgi:hypothetical protein
MPERPVKIDYWAISAALPCDKLCYQVQRHNQTVGDFLDKISDVQTGKANVVVEPTAWLELRHKLATHHLTPSDWSAEFEREKYDELLDFLKSGELPHGVSMDAKHIPALDDDQAAGVLWFLNMVTGLDINDIRYGPCGMCGTMCTSEETRSCEGCEVHLCEDCFAANSGGDDRSIKDWWPEKLNYHESYCDKCVEAIKTIVKEKGSDAKDE